MITYLLATNHAEGGFEAVVFMSFGFTVDDWRTLADALLVHAEIQPVSVAVYSGYGIRCQIDGLVCCPDGRTPSIRVLWIIDTDADTARLVTAYPL